MPTANTFPLDAAYRPHEAKDLNAAGGCVVCGPAGTVFVCAPVEPVAFQGFGAGHFARHLNDERRPCDRCCPKAYAAWVAQAQRVAA